MKSIEEKNKLTSEEKEWIDGIIEICTKKRKGLPMKYRLIMIHTKCLEVKIWQEFKNH